MYTPGCEHSGAMVWIITQVVLYWRVASIDYNNAAMYAVICSHNLTREHWATPVSDGR